MKTYCLCMYVIALSACAESVLSSPAITATKVQKDDRYPAAWWAPVPREGAPAWEILPQDAGAGEVILSKRTELGILSNFAVTSFVFEGKSYASVEGFWQMMKFPEGPNDPRATFAGVTWPHTREVVGQMTGFEAKRAGDLGTANMRTMGIDWVTWNGERMPYRSPQRGRHYDLVRRAMVEKLNQNGEVKRLLLATGDLILKPDHTQDPNSPPEWRYYEMWMELRQGLRDSKTTH